MSQIILGNSKLKSTKQKWWKQFVDQKYLQMFILLGMVYLLVFCYIPMFGIVIAFKDYKYTSGILGFFTSQWVGLKHFIEFVTDYKFYNIVTNTLGISILKLIFSFPTPILFAIMLNEVRGRFFKRFIQTASYLPHFISWVVVSGIAFAFFSTNMGLVNHILQSLNLIDKPISFLSDAKYFWSVAVISDIWKETGWWAIIFIASISGINTTLYEAAEIDGAGRLSRIWNVTLPGIKGAIVVVLVLSIGGLLGGGISGSSFEQCYLLGNSLNIDRSEIIQTYVIKVGLADGRFDYAAAAGLIQSVISLILIFGSNHISKKITGAGAF